MRPSASVRTGRTERSVAICIVTYRRRDMLRRLLRSLGDQVLADAARYEIEIVVVDNDPSRSAEDVCIEARAELGTHLVYHAEPRRGIAHARNAALRAAREADFLVFIDDDEVAEGSWLSELLGVQEELDADVVCGPVVPHFSSSPPGWITRGRFFDRPRHPTGTAVKWVGAGNVLISGRVLRGTDAAFDERFTLSGGEDTEFFLRLQRAGVVVRWADDAVAHETIPESRLSSRWLIKRAYRLGNTIALIDRELGFRPLALRGAKGIARVVIGALSMPLLPLLPKAARVRSLQKTARGIGILAGLVGRRYIEYNTIHGS